MPRHRKTEQHIRARSRIGEVVMTQGDFPGLDFALPADAGSVTMPADLFWHILRCPSCRLRLWQFRGQALANMVCPFIPTENQ